MPTPALPDDQVYARYYGFKITPRLSAGGSPVGYYVETFCIDRDETGAHPSPLPVDGCRRCSYLLDQPNEDRAPVIYEFDPPFVPDPGDPGGGGGGGGGEPPPPDGPRRPGVIRTCRRRAPRMRRRGSTRCARPTAAARCGARTAPTWRASPTRPTSSRSRAASAAREGRPRERRRALGRRQRLLSPRTRAGRALRDVPRGGNSASCRFSSHRPRSAQTYQHGVAPHPPTRPPRGGKHSKSGVPRARVGGPAHAKLPESWSARSSGEQSEARGRVHAARCDDGRRRHGGAHRVATPVWMCRLDRAKDIEAKVVLGAIRESQSVYGSLNDEFSRSSPTFTSRSRATRRPRPCRTTKSGGATSRTC